MFSTTAILAGLVLAAFVFAGFSSLAVGGRGAGGGLFLREGGAVLHGPIFFFFGLSKVLNCSQQGCEAA